MNLKEFPTIPENLIAQEPLRERDRARLLVIDRKDGSLRHDFFLNLDGCLSSGDVLVMNDVKVFPARLIGKKTTGGRVKLLLLKKDAARPERWASLLTPSLPSGARMIFDKDLTAMVEGKKNTGEYSLLFSRSIDEDLETMGTMPLPPYIRRPAEKNAALDALDRNFYQTVYAKTPGAVAAPTAGLHFTDDLLNKIRSRGVEIVFLRLDVGWGTFRPLQSDDYVRHKMLPEEFHIPEETADAVKRARSGGKKIWAVGTTVVRALEGCYLTHGEIRAGPGGTNMFIYPGFDFKIVDRLITNFHHPRHTPLLLAAAFAGPDLLARAYRSAVDEKYRFLSYGDGMAIL